MAAIGGRTLCVTVPELVECGIAEDTVRVGLRRTRSGEVYCWPHHKEGNVIYIHYDGLKERYQRMIDAIHCDGVEANAYIMSCDAQKRQKELMSLCSSLPDMVEVYPADLENLTGSGLFEGVQVQKIARAAGWLRLWRKLDVKTARKMGFSTVVELQNKLFEHCLSEQERGFVKFPKPIGTIRVLDRKAREFDKLGLQTLIGGYFGNANREKISTVIHAVLMDLASSPLKHSFEDIAMIYNTSPEYAHLERMTTSAIKQHLNIPKHKKVWFYLRHGKQAGDDTYQSQAQRETPLLPDQLWSIDGTTSQLYYLDSEGRVKSDMYIYFVADAATGSIIGHSIAYTETSGLVIEALQDAITTRGYKPRQIQYDNSSANVQEVVKGLMRNMSRISFPCTPYRGRAKYVEEIIGHFQQRSLRQHKNFKGGNITTKSLNSQANPDLLKWLRKNPEQLPNESEVIDQIKEAIDNWNTRGERRDNYGRWVGKSKIERYNEPSETRQKLNYFDKLSLFMVELSKPYKYKQQGIAITINGKKRNYIVADPDNSANDFIFSNNNMYREFRVRVNINDPQWIELFDKDGKEPVARAIEKEKFAAVALKGVSRSTIIDFLHKQEENGYDYAFRELREQRQVLEAHGLKATGTGDFFGSNYSDKHGESFGWQDATKSAWNYTEGNLEDVRNGMAEPETRTGAKIRDTLSYLNKL